VRNRLVEKIRTWGAAGAAAGGRSGGLAQWGASVYGNLEAADFELAAHIAVEARLESADQAWINYARFLRIP
jgi:hypothetical protein